MSETSLTNRTPQGPLAGVTVLDLTRVRSGPTAVRQLADWGANVVKIEMPEELEAGDPAGGPRYGPDFQNLHRNKRAMTLDLKAPKGVEVFRRMAEKADVIVENFRPDVKVRLEIDYAAMRAVNPRIVYASISGFGQDGPYRDRPGFDQIAQGMGGLMSITGLPGQGRCGSAFPSPTSALASSARRAFCSLCSSVSARGGAAGRDFAAAGTNLHARLSGCALADQRARCQSRPATTIRLASRQACSRPATATSTSPPRAKKSGSVCVERSGLRA